ncbi:hypothetical protein FIBSPDRAFT_869672 [Athelia psychrophila]|uniref:Uncharacterized protein n=1 Tax=Athelia psychrophila TaxID=1759441 RepID=A0A166BX16_9AGAM|nr:hypothetical protein FIBSPDRAFT_869669 [Fibularhizoctonia sp. CBS 109695]KZP13061.1 hypothetical protein FIBSPDRAFT_869672 [Fibularhizoctonia sp. CBS 109695]
MNTCGGFARPFVKIIYNYLNLGDTISRALEVTTTTVTSDRSIELSESCYRSCWFPGAHVLL